MPDPIQPPRSSTIEHSQRTSNLAPTVLFMGPTVRTRPVRRDLLPELNAAATDTDAANTTEPLATNNSPTPF